ncbi:hypothetical protein [Melissospora conviva]|uniref:hypothetical protein n=1 Tax=Melissospora conviva TaxID=3388432 RepID=UPI003B7EDC74
MTELWNWRIERRSAQAEVHTALAEAIGRPVLSLAGAAAGLTAAGAVLCDVWHAPGDFPTVVDCYAPPENVDEHAAVAALARRLGVNCLLRDDTLDAGRHLLVGPDGTIRPVHFDVADTDDGEVLTNQRLCTHADPGCRGWSRCQRSRWTPDSVLSARTAA